MQENEPLVSICSLTYNHAPYLEDFFEGIISQKTNFAFEIIINDDCSCDGSQEILRKYEKLYPEIVKVIYHDENLYSKGERGILVKYCYPRCRGKYVAFCEGDDFWTDCYKLQKQVDYLETHDDCVLVHTDMDILDNTTGKIVVHGKWRKLKNFNQIQRDFNGKLIPYLLQGLYSVTTLTVCARFDDVKEICKQYDFRNDKKLVMGDTPQWVALASRGKFHFMRDITSTYRVLEESASHSKNFDKVLNFYNSCLYMVERLSFLFNISSKEKNKAIQEYLYFILLDIYKDKMIYMDQLTGAIPGNSKLSLSNSILIKTMNFPLFFKKYISFCIRAVHFFSHRILFYHKTIFT